MTSRYGFEPKIIGFLCNWCCYAGADLAGVSRFQYPHNIRIIRVMCSGRIEPSFIFRSFSKGADGVFIGGCHFGDCHYVTEGNYDALSMVHISKKLLEQVGIDPERLRIEWVSAAEGIRFAEIMTDFTDKLKKMGPLGTEEGIKDEKRLELSLEAAQNIVPYIKLVERESLRVRFKTEEEYNQFFSSSEIDNLFKELIADKLAMEKIMLLLGERPLSTGDISDTLGLTQSEVSRHLKNTARQGLVKFDEKQKLFTTA